MTSVFRPARTSYGASAFAVIRDNGCVYADKTRFIETLEATMGLTFFSRGRGALGSLFLRRCFPATTTGGRRRRLRRALAGRTSERIRRRLRGGFMW